MNMIRCANGHFYDLDRFMFCPHCNQPKNEGSSDPFLKSVKSSKTILINKGIFKVGRDRHHSDFCITDNAYVSRTHADIVTRSGRYFIVDKNSTHKTFVDGKQIIPNKEVEIKNSSKIRFANEDFVFYCVGTTSEEIAMPKGKIGKDEKIMKTMPDNLAIIESKITDVVVYLSGAQITRTGKISLTQGIQSFVFSGLPADIERENIQVASEDDIVILSVDHYINYMKSPEQTKKTVELQEELKKLKKQLAQETNKIKVGEAEEGLLKETICNIGQKSGFDLEGLKSAISLYNERLKDIKENQITYQENSEEIIRNIESVESQLGNFYDSKSKPISEVVVTYHSKDVSVSLQEKTFSISYFTRSASWIPFYDIRVQDTTKGVSLYYKANVMQDSGETWDNVKLILSTDTPDKNKAIPELRPWYVRAANMHPPISRQPSPPIPPPMYASETTILGASSDSMESPLLVESSEQKAASVPPAQATESMTSIEFSINSPYTINSGDNDQNVDIAKYDLPTRYKHYSVRKLDKDVFLLAEICDWEQLNLIPGKASVFFENRYVGKAYLDPFRTDNKLEVSLGVDKSIPVSRVKKKDYTSQTFTGGNLKQSRYWEIKVCNYKTTPVYIELLDQIPVSTDKQIAVEITDCSGAEVDNDTGILKWQLMLQPSETKTLNIKYVVTSPKNVNVFMN